MVESMPVDNGSVCPANIPLEIVKLPLVLTVTGPLELAITKSAFGELRFMAPAVTVNLLVVESEIRKCVLELPVTESVPAKLMVAVQLYLGSPVVPPANTLFIPPLI